MDFFKNYENKPTFLSIIISIYPIGIGITNFVKIGTGLKVLFIAVVFSEFLPSTGRVPDFKVAS